VDKLRYTYFRTMPKSAFSPCIPTRGTKVPNRDDWFHEVKHDGYRLLIQQRKARAPVDPQRS
jgi:ATP-dependent DNA ligase